MVFPLFQSLRPFYVATAMTYGTKANIVVPSPETYVKSALYTLGLSRRNTGYWSHGIQVFHYFIYSFSCYFSFSRIPYLTPHSIFSFFSFFAPSGGLGFRYFFFLRNCNLCMPG